MTSGWSSKMASASSQQAQSTFPPSQGGSRCTCGSLPFLRFLVAVPPESASGSNHTWPGSQPMRWCGLLPATSGFPGHCVPFFKEVLCQSTTTTFLKVSFSFFKDVVAVPEEEEEVGTSLKKGCVLGLFQGTGWVCLQSLASCLVSLSLRACSLAASSALQSLALLWDLDLGPFLPLLGKALSRSSSAFFKAASSSFKASFFCFSCSSADAWAFFKASSFSSKLSGEVQGGVSLGQRSPLHPLPSSPLAWGGGARARGPGLVVHFRTWLFQVLFLWFFQTSFLGLFLGRFGRLFQALGVCLFQNNCSNNSFRLLGSGFFKPEMRKEQLQRKVTYLCVVVVVRNDIVVWPSCVCVTSG